MGKNSTGAQFGKKTTPAPTFSTKNTQFYHFWAPFGSPNGLQNGPLDVKLGLNWPRGGPRGLREPILVDFGGFCLHFGVHFGAPGGNFGTLLAHLFGEVLPTCGY